MTYPESLTLSPPFYTKIQQPMGLIINQVHAFLKENKMSPKQASGFNLLALLVTRPESCHLIDKRCQAHAPDRMTC
jgi:hypothetical protein